MTEERGDGEWLPPSALTLTQFPSDNCVNVDADAKQHGVGGNEVDDALLIEASGVTMRANIIVVKSGQATAIASMPAASPSTATDIVRHRTL